MVDLGARVEFVWRLEGFDGDHECLTAGLLEIGVWRGDGLKRYRTRVSGYFAVLVSLGLRISVCPRPARISINSLQTTISLRHRTCQ